MSNLNFTRLIQSLFLISFLFNSFSSLSTGNDGNDPHYYENNSPNTPCYDIAPFCSSEEHEFPNAVNQYSAASGMGCLYTTPNPIWYYMKIDESGPIQIKISQHNAITGAGLDVDFAMWGPYNDIEQGCDDITVGAHPKQCSYSPAPTETIGLGYPGGYASGYSNPPPAVQGEYYIILITNYSNQNGYITLEQIDGTGSTECITCVIKEVNVESHGCSPVQNTYNLTGSISFEFYSAPETGTLMLEDCYGNQLTIAEAPYTDSVIVFNLEEISGQIVCGDSCYIIASFIEIDSTEICKFEPEYFIISCYCDFDELPIPIEDINTCSLSVNLNDVVPEGIFGNKLFFSTEIDAYQGSNPINPEVSEPGTYWLRIGSSTGISCFEVFEFEVTISPLEYTAIIENEHCDNTNGSISLYPSGGTAPYSYSIDNGANFKDDNYFFNLPSGGYDIMIMSSNDCVTSGHEFIDNQQGPTFTEITTTNVSCFEACDGEVNASINGGLSPLAFVWTNSNGDIISTQANASGLCDDTYYLSVTDYNGCTITAEATITQPELLVVKAPEEINICEGESIVLTVENPNNAAISWNNGVIDGISFTPDVGTHTYTVTALMNNCSSSDQVVINVAPIPQPDFVADKLEGCSPLEVNFTNTSNLQGANCIWSFSDGAEINSCGDVSHTFEEADFYDVSFTIESTEGCVGEITKSNYIEVKQQPIASFSSNYNENNLSNPDISFDNTSVNSTSYLWNFGDGSLSTNEINPSHTFSTDLNQEYVITLVAYNIDGSCTDTAQSVIKVENIFTYFVPNTFTPDGDEFNQTFKPIFSSGIDPYQYNLFIYNRWGEVLFESHDIDKGWDGTYGGEISQDGTYIWKIEFKEALTNKNHSEIGHVNLIK